MAPEPDEFRQKHVSDQLLPDRIHRIEVVRQRDQRPHQLGETSGPRGRNQHRELKKSQKIDVPHGQGIEVHPQTYPVGGSADFGDPVGGSGGNEDEIAVPHRETFAFGEFHELAGLLRVDHRNTAEVLK